MGSNQKTRPKLKKGDVIGDYQITKVLEADAEGNERYEAICLTCQRFIRVTRNTLSFARRCNHNKEQASILPDCPCNYCARSERATCSSWTKCEDYRAFLHRKWGEVCGVLNHRT